jgi:hypothetical protein
MIDWLHHSLQVFFFFLYLLVRVPFPWYEWQRFSKTRRKSVALLVVYQVAVTSVADPAGNLVGEA